MVSCSTTLVYPLRRSISGSCHSSSIVLPVGLKQVEFCLDIMAVVSVLPLGSSKNPNMMILLHHLSLVAVHHSFTFNTSQSGLWRLCCWHFISSWVSTLLQPSTIIMQRLIKSTALLSVNSWNSAARIIPSIQASFSFLQVKVQKCAFAFWFQSPFMSTCEHRSHGCSS